MKLGYYFMVIAATATVVPSLSYSSYLSEYTNLVEIKPNPTRVGSKPALSGIKTASVSFITGSDEKTFVDYNLNIEAACKAAGYYTTKSKCAEQDSYWGPSCPLAGGEEYVSGCCSKSIYTVEKPEQCINSHNMSYSGSSCVIGNDDGTNSRRYHCSCDRSTYPFGEDNPCTSGFSPDESKMCIDDEGKEYYASCCATDEYEAICDASKHLIGSGNSCIIDGITKWQSCTCALGYNVQCSTWLYDESDYCTPPGKSVRYTTDDNCYDTCTGAGYEDLRYYFYGTAYTDENAVAHGWLEKMFDESDGVKEND